jgi:hypothetical protein
MLGIKAVKVTEGTGFKGPVNDTSFFQKLVGPGGGGQLWLHVCV